MMSQPGFLRSLAAAAVVTLLPVVANGASDFENDYPTATRADYVFGCMAANGQTRDVLQQCACSIDLIASILPYDKYVEAETVLQMRQSSGEKTAFFKTSPAMQALVDDMRRAQAEAELRCF